MNFKPALFVSIFLFSVHPFFAQPNLDAESKTVELDFSKIRIKHQPVWPPYPADWPPLKSRDTVTLSIVINEEGIPISAKTLVGSYYSGRYAELHLLNWRFHPVIQDGIPQKVKFKMVVPVYPPNK